MVTLTNSTLEVAEDQVRNAGLRDLLDGVYSADEVSMLKPAPEPYRHVLERRRASPADAVLIAAHDWDVAGAAAAGMRSAFIAREGHVPLPAVDAPTVTSDSLRGIATELVRLGTEQDLGNRSQNDGVRRSMLGGFRVACGTETFAARFPGQKFVRQAPWRYQ